MQKYTVNQYFVSNILNWVQEKEIDKRFNSFWTYLKNSTEIKEARKEIKQKKVISQEKLFKKLGL